MASESLNQQVNQVDGDRNVTVAKANAAEDCIDGFSGEEITKEDSMRISSHNDLS